VKLGIALPTSQQGVYLPTPFAGRTELAAIVKAAERLHLDSAWVLDFMTPVYDRHRAAGARPEWYESMTSLAYLAGVTDRIKLGTACIQLPLRDPFLLARQAATLDVLSGGRVLLGVGLGHLRAEFAGMRPRDRHLHRGALLEESLHALHRFFGEETVTFEGAHYQCHELTLTPRPLQQPFPLYLAGKTEDSLRRLARWGAGWLLSRMQAEGVEERVSSLLPHLERAGRRREDVDIVVTKGLSLGRTHEAALARFRASMLPGRMDEIAAEAGIAGRPSAERIYHQNLIGTPDEVAEQLDGIRRQGVDHCILMYFAVDNATELLEQLQWFGEEVVHRTR
jgi:probable F420-dependent oxidoreductase